MDEAGKAVLMQVIGVSAAIAPILALFVALGLTSRRRQAAESTDPVERSPQV
jgi:hypothetical protein